MRRLPRLVPLVGMLAAAMLVSHCQVIGGFAGHEIVDPAQGGASGGRGGDGGLGGDDTCTLLQAPSAPVSPPPGDDETFTLAVRSVDFGEDLDGPLGLDLDDACTCGDEACPCAAVTTCARPSVVASDDNWQRCDAVNGVDANSRQLFRVLQGFEGVVSSGLVSSVMASGGGSMLLDVRQYNGLADDDNVLVGVYTTGNFRSAECNDGPPSWDGNDAWPIDVESALGSVPACNGTPSPSVFDAFAYVADNQLVAHFDEVTLAIEFDPNTLRLTLRDAVVVAPLQQDADGRWSTEGGILAGTWPVDGVFRSLGSLDAVTPLDLCGSELRSIQSTVCGAADLATHSRTADPCDAVSLAIAFKAEEATFGNTVTLPPTTSCPELLALDCETAVR